MAPTVPQSGFLVVAKTIGITAPAIYAGVTFAYSSIVVPPLVAHSPPKLLAKQWLQAYQYGPKFVPPLVLGGILSNAVLAYLARFPRERLCYIMAAVGIGSIIPVTALYMEPGINGAAKWKVGSLLKDEGFSMEDGFGVTRQSATPETRRWAEGQEMKDIVQVWSAISSWRIVIAGAASIASGVAMNWPW